MLKLKLYVEKDRKSLIVGDKGICVPYTLAAIYAGKITWNYEHAGYGIILSILNVRIILSVGIDRR